MKRQNKLEGVGFTYSCLCAPPTVAENLDVFIPAAALAPAPAEGLLVVTRSFAAPFKDWTDCKLLLVKDAVSVEQYMLCVS